MKISLCLLFLTVLLLTGCNGETSTQEQAAASSEVASTFQSVEEIVPQALGTYEGTIPCADCEGIRLELTLEDNPAAKSRTYVIRETYIGSSKENNVLESKGDWLVLDGPDENPTATIFQLNPDPAGDVRYFVRLSDTEIEMLNHNMQNIDTSLNYRLHKQVQ